MKDFYRKFKIISYFPLWPFYLRWVYGKTLKDTQTLGVTSILTRKNPTILLCGVSGEITANEFIRFVLKNNNKSKIIIIDLGEEQIESVSRLVNEKYPRAHISIKQKNALDLGFIKDNSIDWIDTDGFFSFFDIKQLVALFKEWKRILKEDGYITFRELTSHGLISTFANKLRDTVSRLYIRTRLHLHSTSELEKDFQELKFQYVSGGSPIPLLDRYCLINQQKTFM